MTRQTDQAQQIEDKVADLQRQLRDEKRAADRLTEHLDRAERQITELTRHAQVCAGAAQRETARLRSVLADTQLAAERWERSYRQAQADLERTVKCGIEAIADEVSSLQLQLADARQDLRAHAHSRQRPDPGVRALSRPALAPGPHHREQCAGCAGAGCSCQDRLRGLCGAL